MRVTASSHNGLLFARLASICSKSVTGELVALLLLLLYRRDEAVNSLRLNHTPGQPDQQTQ